ncbi:MAG TPA: hypothetical protein DCS41_06660 [Gammaproteobacteria bacterium]|nr:hypothetical protein [Gammaproteobacteria bacterium]
MIAFVVDVVDQLPVIGQLDNTPTAKRQQFAQAIVRHLFLNCSQTRSERLPTRPKTNKKKSMPHFKFDRYQSVRRDLQLVEGAW